jgi:hypothetical protein
MKTLRQIKKICIAVAGFSVLLIGLAMIILPGTIIIIPLGLTILATEFVWAKHWLEKMKFQVERATNGFRKKNLTLIREEEIQTVSAPAETMVNSQ